MRISKQQWVFDLLRRRIVRGEYGQVLPGAPHLAEELGVSLVTVYGALQQLCRAGTAAQGSNGRIVLPSREKTALKAVILLPAGVFSFNKWFAAIRESALEYGCELRHVSFLYCDDQSVFRTLKEDDFDILFIHSFGWFAANPLLMCRLRPIADKVVTLFHDATKLGFRMLDGYGPEAMIPLMNHLLERGCRRIDFFSHVKHPRLKTAELYLRPRKAFGHVHIFTSGTEQSLIEQAYRHAKHLLAEGAFRRADAVYCQHSDLALALGRALRENGRRIPEDISLVSFGSPENAAMQNPSLTVVGNPPLRSLTDAVFRHYLGIDPQPGRLKFTGDTAGTAPEDLIVSGDSVRGGQTENKKTKETT